MYEYFSQDEIETLFDLLSHICDVTPDDVFNEDRLEVADVIGRIKNLSPASDTFEIFGTFKWIKNVLHYDDFWNWSTQEMLAVGKVKTMYNIMTSNHEGRGYGYDEGLTIRSVLTLHMTQCKTKNLPEIRRIIRTIEGGGVLASEDYRFIKGILLESVGLIQDNSELCTRTALVIVQTDAIIKYRETHNT